MLDFVFSEVDPSQGSFAAAVNELRSDLNGSFVTSSSINHVRRFWILGDEFNWNKSAGGSEDTGKIDTAVYCPADPILYASEHNAVSSPGMTWNDAINYIIDQWYDSLTELRPGTQHPNPLRITNNWTPTFSLESYYGGLLFTNKSVSVEGYAAARLARYIGRADPRFDRLIQLANGDLNYLLGINFGLRSRQVLQAAGVAPTDLNYVGASLINGVGTRWGVQTLQTSEYYVWTKYTTMSGPGGYPEPLKTGVTITDWIEAAPFDYSRGIYGNGAETFIKTDANVIMLIETLDRAMHPKLVVETETGSSSAPLNITSNNVSPYFNGGMSVINLGSGASITYSSLMPPDTANTPFHNFHYRMRLRASNTGTAQCPVSISVNQGAYHWSDTFLVPVTSHPHDYVVVDNMKGFYQSSPLTLINGMAFSVVLSIGGSGFGPCSFDDFVIESEGVLR